MDQPPAPNAEVYALALREARRHGRTKLGVLLRTVPFAVKTVWRASPGLALALLFFTVAMGVVPTVTVYVNRLVLDAVVSVVSHGPRHIDPLTWALVFQAAVTIAGVWLGRGQTFLSFGLGRQLGMYMNAQLLQRSGRLEYRLFEEPRFYDIMSRAQRESAGRPLELVQQMSGMLRSAMTFLTMAGLMLGLSVLLFGAALAVAVPLMIVQMRFGATNYALQRSRTEESRMANFISTTMTTRRSVPEILSFGLWPYLFDRWHDATRRFLRQDVQLMRRRTFVEGLWESVQSLSTVGALAYIVYLGVGGGGAGQADQPLTVGQIMMYAAGFTGAANACRMMLGGLSGIYENALFLNDLVEFEQLEAAQVPLLAQPTRPIPAHIETLELVDVSFRYPGSSRDALKNVNLRFDRTQSTLIVGANGAGKTTLIRLLIRLYEPTRGRILLNGIDIRDFAVHQLRQSVGVIFQDFLQLPLTAAQNIGCGCVAAMDDQARIESAARRAGADGFIRKLDSGYQTMLSRVFAGGQELSLGQWQRICLGRLFMKDAPVLVFDEPSASLDIQGEAHLLSEISSLARERICILISHRALRPGIAQRLVVLADGQVAETGCFEDLVARDGAFARLWRMYQHAGT
ncbi:MAG: ABC transporter ATP-binding protein [Phycisphaeraceae bacterium]|nr:ABC transporter ATP-binding protein [Phycisphaeraceae bacterium]